MCSPEALRERSVVASDASDAEVDDALGRARSGVGRDLPNGADTLVGEEARSSPVTRQCVALAGSPLRSVDSRPRRANRVDPETAKSSSATFCRPPMSTVI
jgi:hypothetical protein